MTFCTECLRLISGVSPDVMVCGDGVAVLHVDCARRTLGWGAFLVPPQPMIDAWKRKAAAR